MLPRAKREALCAVYAFMRRCDDISDDPKLGPAERRGQLESWLEALHEDNRAIIRAASAASKAADYLLAFREAANIPDIVKDDGPLIPALQLAPSLAATS